MRRLSVPWRSRCLSGPALAGIHIAMMPGGIAGRSESDRVEPRVSRLEGMIAGSVSWSRSWHPDPPRWARDKVEKADP